MNMATLATHPVSIAYHDQGTGPVIVLLHAFPLDHFQWQPQWEVLSPNYRVIAPDLPGFGNSTDLADWTIDVAADIVAELISTLGVMDPVVLCGLSMGGYIALAFARRHPHLLRGLILADTKATADDDAAKAGREKAMHLANEQGSAAVINGMIPKALSLTTQVAQLDIVETVRAMGSRQRVSGVIDAIETLRDRPDATDSLANVSVPTLVIVGTEDAITPPAMAQMLADKIAGAKLVTLDAAGHLSNLEVPEAFTTAVQEFLEGL